GVRVWNANNYFVVAATLLLYQDHGASQVTGAVTRNTLATDPSPVVEKNLTTAPDGTITGTVTTTARRQLTIAGYVHTSHGRVETTVAQNLDFSNRQEFTVAATRYVQNITQGTKIDSGTETRQGSAVALAGKHLSYPLTLNIDIVANADGSNAQTTTYDQKYDSQEARIGKGVPFLSTVSNHAASADTLLFAPSGALTGFQDRKSSQDYFSLATDSGCYSRSITAQDGLLATVTDGKGCPSR
ncbi:MAG TPA: peptide-N(4)-(N-acetyl-beta-glucosaminyl)asparagine amidase, partial [Thermoanaerobaculia bacterium]|nr:peptide-N(4)-(N-acetyl-beta-glucosaminyl)asparagine amidase [Thermoanaerobaculia bacterium]